MKKLIKTVTCFDVASYKVGVCVGNRLSQQIIKLDSLLTEPASKSALSDQERAEEVADYMLAYIKHYKPERVLIENNRFSFGRSNRGLQEYWVHGNIRVVERYCFKKGIDCVVANFNQVLSAVCGSRAEDRNKENLANRLRWMLGLPLDFKFKNDDESDAAGYFLYDILTQSSHTEK